MSVIDMKHGSDGRAMDELIQRMVAKFERMGEVPLHALDDAGAISNVVMSIDSYTLKPLFFPGGDIGKLAVCGTINDISMLGASPKALSLSYIIEDGFPIKELESITESVAEASREAGVPVISGDTKIVEKGKGDGVFITTSGFGLRTEALKKNMDIVRDNRDAGRWPVDSGIRDGDVIIVSGYIGDHGTALLSSRGCFDMDLKVKSDVQPLHRVVQKVLSIGGIVTMKDPTKGGLAGALNEWAVKSKTGILIEEERIPIREPVKTACEGLGIDALALGNAGRMILAVLPDMADAVLDALKSMPETEDAAIIGRALRDTGRVVMKTEVGGRKVVEQPVDDPAQGIC